MADRRTFIAAGITAAAWPYRAQAQLTPGVTATAIKVGNTCAYSGPASPFGTNDKVAGAGRVGNGSVKLSSHTKEPVAGDIVSATRR